MTVSQITNHDDQALARLAEQFKDQANIAAVIQAFADQIQDAEDALYALINCRTVAYATGATLDAVGEMVGQPRSIDGPDATDDEAYRALIYARILINTSYGTAEDVLGFLRQIGADGARLFEPGNATLEVYTTGTLLINDDGLVDALTAATAPVELNVIEYTVPAFGFDGDPDALGFGEGELSRRIV